MTEATTNGRRYGYRWRDDPALLGELMGSRMLRRRTIRHTAVLAKAGKLKSLRNLRGKFTTAQVAEFYEVPEETIHTLVHRNREELIANGLTTISAAAFRKLQEVRTRPDKSGTVATFTVKVATDPDNSTQTVLGNLAGNARVRLFSRRAVLNVGQLLTESKVAEAVRGYLLEAEERLDPDTADALLAELDYLNRLYLSLAEQLEITIQQDVMILPKPDSGQERKVRTTTRTIRPLARSDKS